MGTTAFMSVPYALSSGSTINSLWKDNGNHLSPDSTASQDIIISGQTDISGGIAIDGNADIWGTTRMSVVGIGTTNPTETLDVDGNVRMRNGSSSGYIAVSDSVGVMNWTDPMTINTLQGIQGLAGNDGVDGSDGTNGSDGTPGTNGTNGTNGTDGVDGTNGTPGTNGTNGADGQGGVTNAGTGISVTGYGTSFSPYLVSTTLSAVTYSIGDTAQGGIVFYVSPDGKNGLVAATVDQSTISLWYNAFNVISSPFNHTLEGQKFRDWRLPTKYELYEMYLNLHQQGLGGFANSHYWSSSESINADAWGQNFLYGYQNDYDKNSFHYVRAVRAF